jgi:hypothetical protein
MIENKIQTFFLLEIAKLWKENRKDSLPWGIWVREYINLQTLDSPNISIIPSFVWFLDKNGFTRKSTSEFQRFIIVQSGKFWCKSFWGEPSIVFGRRHEIGLSSFGNIYGESQSYYFDFQFGGLFGRGYKYKFDEIDNPISHTGVWIS